VKADAFELPVPDGITGIPRLFRQAPQRTASISRSLRGNTGLSAESIVAYCKVWNDWALSLTIIILACGSAEYSRLKKPVTNNAMVRLPIITPSAI